MAIRDIEFKSLYRKTDDILRDFYIPALSNATEYKRVSGYFSADVLKLYSKGLSAFVKNGGKIKFIFSHHLTKEDYDAIKQGYDGRFDNELLSELDSLEDDVGISNLSCLISRGIVDVKIGFMVPGTLHFKFGLIKDGNDIVCFRGSTNETPAGMLYNGENFEVSCSWLSGEHELNTINGYEKDFDDLWNNTYPDVTMVDAPKCVLSKFDTFNKHEIIEDYTDQSRNCFILDINEKQNLVGFSFLDDKSLLSKESLFYKTKLDYAVDHVRNNEVFYFKHFQLQEIKFLIDILKKRGDEKDFDVIISSRLQNFLRSLELYLDKRVSLGNAIKNKDEVVFERFNKFSSIVNEELTRELKTPQMWDAFHATEMVAASNFSVPGTGKTSIAYGAYAYLSSKKAGEKVKRIIMVGPKNSFMAWKNEFVLCFGDKRRLSCYNCQNPMYKNNNQRVAALYREFKQSNLILINYDRLLNFDFLNTLKMLMSSDNFSDYLILDEAHKIKGFQGKRANAVLELSTLAKYKLILTGTPIPNSYLDIYNLLNILYSADYENFFAFTPKYLEDASFIPSRQEEINKKFYPFFCRTTKNDLKLPLPTFNYEDGAVIMDEREQHLFDLLYYYFGRNIFSLYIKLVQASNNPSLVLNKITQEDVDSFFGSNETDDQDDSSAEFEKDFSNQVLSEANNKIQMDPSDYEFINNFGYTRKFERGIQIVEELCNKNKSVVAWGVFVKTLESIHRELESRGIKSVVISGSMPLEEREKNIDRFIKGEFQVLISNPHTLAESVSLHHVCHDAVYFEYTFNLTHMLQSRDRIHRLGLSQDTITTYYYLSLDNGGNEYNAIDLKTIDRLKLKEERMIKAVETKQLYIKTESYKEDIEFIFSKN